MEILFIIIVMILSSYLVSVLVGVMLYDMSSFKYSSDLKEVKSRLYNWLKLTCDEQNVP